MRAAEVERRAAARGRTGLLGAGLGFLLDLAIAVGGLVVVDGDGEDHRLGRAARLFGGELRLFLLLVGGMVVAPFAVVLLVAVPALLLGLILAAALDPVRLGDGLTLALRAGVEFPAPGVEAAGVVAALFEVAFRQGVAAAVVDHDQFAPVVAVGILRITDQVGIVRTRFIIVVAVAAARQGLGHPHGAVIGAPDPGLGALIVESIVRRRVAERLVLRIGVVGEGVIVGAVGQVSDGDRRGGRQSRGDRRGRDRGAGFGQRQSRRRRGGHVRLSGLAPGERQCRQANEKGPARGAGEEVCACHLPVTPIGLRRSFATARFVCKGQCYRAGMNRG